MSMKRSAQRKAPSVTPIWQRKMLTTTQNARLLDMLKERRNYAAVWRHYEIKLSSVRYINKEENTKF